MLRDEAEQLLRSGVRWHVTYCAGADRPDDKGAGLSDFPVSILAAIPNPAQKRKLAQGKHDRSYAFAKLTDESGEPLLLVEEE